MILNAIAEKLKRQSKDDFKGRHFEAWLIVQAVTWYLRYPLSYRDLESMFLERGFEVDHSTVNHWVLAYAPQIEKRLRQFRRPHCGSIRVDETYVKIRGKWRYLYRAIVTSAAAPRAKLTQPKVAKRCKLNANQPSTAAFRIIRLILDGTVVRVRFDKKATSISLLVALGVRVDGQKVLLAIKNMGGESEAAWRALLDDLVKRGLKTPELVIVDGAPGLEKALAALWSDVPVQRCTVHKHRNLLAHAPERLHEEISNDYRDMIYAATKQEVEAKRKAFIRKWRLKCRAVADSLEEAGDKLFTFTRFPQSQWKSIRTSNAIERLHEEFKRRIKTQTVLPSAETAAMLFWALMASGQIIMRKVDGWQSPAEKPADQIIDLAA